MPGPPTRGRRIAAAIIFLQLGFAGHSPAQSVRIVVRSEASGSPIEGALVTLLNEQGLAVARALSEAGGHLFLNAPGPGTYRIRGDRPGHSGVSSPPFVLRNAESTPYDLELPSGPITLPKRPPPEECLGSGVRGPDRVVWDEIEKGLLAIVVTRDRAHQLEVRRFERTLNERGRVLNEITLGTGRARGRPYIIPKPEQLWREGFVAARGEETVYHVPDPELFLSPGFQALHCFRLIEGESARKRWLGLAFESLPGRSVTDISGTIWLDRAGPTLREVEFRFNDPEVAERFATTGLLELVGRGGGEMLERRWVARTPHVQVTPGQRVGTVRLPDRTEVTGYIEKGGEVEVLPEQRP